MYIYILATIQHVINIRTLALAGICGLWFFNSNACGVSVTNSNGLRVVINSYKNIPKANTSIYESERYVAIKS